MPSFIKSRMSFAKSFSHLLRHWLSYRDAQGTDETASVFKSGCYSFPKMLAEQQELWRKRPATASSEKRWRGLPHWLSPAAISSSRLTYKLISRLIEICENECNAKESDDWLGRDITRGCKAADEARQAAVEQLRQVRYFWKQAHWLTERFPEAKLRDVEGLVKLVNRTEIEANDWSLTLAAMLASLPKRNEESDFEEALREIHVELEDLNAEAVQARRDD